MTLEVTRLSIQSILENLKSGEWQIPKFQREFVWSQSQVFSLLHSIFKSRPVGLVTIWEQPQGRPHTDAEPITLRTEVYKDFSTNPAIMKYVLDGRQRLTALAIAFGGLREKDARRSFSGRWFINLDADPEDNEEKLIVYKRPYNLENEKLDTPAVCLASALIPLDQYFKFDVYSGNVNNPDYYSDGRFPDELTRETRRRRLASYEKTFLQFQVPIASLPKTVSLAQVCDIFDVLNTTGTKVSTFDLVHNNNYSSTAGLLDLRTVFNECPEKFTSLGLLCDPQRSEFFCQLVTACYLTNEIPIGIDKKPVRSIKGGDLVNTPTDVYLKVIENLSRIDSFCAGLFSLDLLGGRFYLRQLPYPASLLLYIALRWSQDFAATTEEFATDDLNRVFKAFFWSNVFAGRYDQGFLTLFSSDLKELRRILSKYKTYGDRTHWAKEIDKDLDAALFTGTVSRAKKEEIKQDLLNGEFRGAKKQALVMFLLSSSKTDFATGESLDYFTEDKDRRVQLHHIFPKRWCADNKASHTAIDQNMEIVNSFANLMPLTSASNNAWMTRSPATAIQYFSIAYNEADPRFANAFIDKSMFEVLLQTEPDPMKFWEMRADRLAERLHSLQYVAKKD